MCGIFTAAGLSQLTLCLDAAIAAPSSHSGGLEWTKGKEIVISDPRTRVCRHSSDESYRVHFLEEDVLQVGHGWEYRNVASDTAEKGGKEPIKSHWKVWDSVLEMWLLGHDFTCQREPAAPPLTRCWCFCRQIWQHSPPLLPAQTSSFKANVWAVLPLKPVLPHLPNLDVVPLLGGLQCLQVVTGRVVVDQFSPPFGDFFLHSDAR